MAIFGAMFRKPVSLFLLFTLGLCTVGVYPVFMALQYDAQREIRKCIKNGLPEDELDVIFFAAGSSPEWIRPGKEFIHKGEMYDVVRTGPCDGGIAYHCINDRREKDLRTRLAAALKEDFHRGESPGAKTCHYLQMLLTQNYLPAEGYSIRALSGKCSFLNYRDDLPPQVLIRSNTPPPEFG